MNSSSALSLEFLGRHVKAEFFNSPLSGDASDGSDQFVKVEWFSYVCREAAALKLGQFVAVEAREGDCWRTRGGVVGVAHKADHFQAGEPGQFDVHENDVESLCLSHFQGFFPIVYRNDAISMPLQGDSSALPGDAFIFDK